LYQKFFEETGNRGYLHFEDMQEDMQEVPNDYTVNKSKNFLFKIIYDWEQVDNIETLTKLVNAYCSGEEEEYKKKCEPTYGPFDRLMLGENIKSLSGLFKDKASFNTRLYWNTKHVTDMSYMFQGATKFNNGALKPSDRKPLNFNTSQVSNMMGMFMEATNFNQPLGDDFDTRQVTNMGYMFQKATNFNQPLGEKFIPNDLPFMRSMFEGATSFNKSYNTVFGPTTAECGSLDYLNSNYQFDLEIQDDSASKMVGKVEIVFNNDQLRATKLLSVLETIRKKQTEEFTFQLISTTKIDKIDSNTFCIKNTPTTWKNTPTTWNLIPKSTPLDGWFQELKRARERLKKV
jgi:hypothetical protein